MIPDVLLICTKTWQDLDPQVQKWVQQAADESSVFQRKLWKEKTIQSLEEAKADGVTIYEVDKTLFAEKVKPMYDAIDNEKIKDLVAGMRKVKQ